jgi:hypothetical protein
VKIVVLCKAVAVEVSDVKIAAGVPALIEAAKKEKPAASS